MSPSIRELLDAARRARSNAYSPYSHFKVGAAIRTVEGQVFAGCNVENASYGGTICAERVAITAAVAQLGPLKVAEVLVLSDASPPWPPCGMCRQVIAEFAENCVVHCANESGEAHSQPFAALFPQGFEPGHLA